MALITSTPTEDELKEILLALESMEEVQYLAKRAQEDPELFDLMLKLGQSDEYPVNWYSVWTLKHASKKHEHLLEPYSDTIHKWVLTTPPKAIHRELLHFVNHMPLNDEYSGYLLDKCVEWVTGNYSIAVKARCFHYFRKLMNQEPDLAPEFEVLAREQLLMNPSSGLKNIVTKLIKDIEKLNNN